MNTTHEPDGVEVLNDSKNESRGWRNPFDASIDHGEKDVFDI